MNKLPELSLFFPTYNEAGNIEEAVKQALTVLPQVAEKFEIIVVNDGSHDATLSIAKRLARRYTSVRVVSQPNKGYGGSLKLGFKSAHYDWVFFTDSDLQFDLMELKKFVKVALEHDLVIGFRKNRAEGWKRQLLATMLKLWNRIFLAFPIYIKDTDCGFKLIHRRVLQATIPLISDGAMVSTEFLLKAHKLGFRFAQIGVTHYERRIGTPTGNNWKVIFKAVRDTFTLQHIFFQESRVGRLATKVSFRLAYRLGLSV